MDVTSIPFGLALIITFLAGIISFISPCVLPLIPAYVGYMGGRVTNKVAAQVSVGSGGQATAALPLSIRFSTFAHGVAFVMGFTFVFVIIGLLTTAFISALGQGSVNQVTSILGRIGGVVLIFFGLHFMGVIPGLFARLRANNKALNTRLVTLVIALGGSALLLWGFTGTIAVWDEALWQTAVWSLILALILVTAFMLWLVLDGAFTQPQTFWMKVINSIENALYADTRRQMMATGTQGLLGSAFMGVVFSAGWTPCIGPVYGAALNLAITGTGANVALAGVLLTVYSLGLGIPFLLTTVLLDSAQGLLRRLQRQMHTIELVSGALLIIIGITVATGRLQLLSQGLRNNQLAVSSVAIEQNMIDTLTGQNSAEAPTEAASDTTQTGQNSAETQTGAASDTSVGSITGLAQTGGPVEGLAIGNVAPNFKTVTDTGAPIALSDFRGKLVLLNFWATWCGPCRIEMPAFQSAFSQHNSEGLTIVAVNYMETADKAAGFRKDFGLTFPIAMDTDGALRIRYNILGYPTTYLLNRDGVIVALQPGPMTVQQIRDLVSKALTG